MRAARFYAAGDIRIEDIPEPVPKDGEVLIDVEWGGICGTDLHEYLIGPFMIPTNERPHPLTGESAPITLCHEFCGRLSKVPAGAKSADGQELKEGMAVMVDPRLNCRTCFSCTDHASNICARMGFRGLSGGGGGFAEMVAVPPHVCYPLPDGVELADAALIEPLAVGRHALTASGVTDWSKLSVLVVGGGPVGLSVLFNLRAAGAHDVFLSEPTAKRQDQCQKLSSRVLDPTQVKVPDECRKLTKDEGVDVVFDCAGITPGMHDGSAALRPKGTYVNVAGWETPFVLPLGVFMFNELTLKMSLGYNEKDFGDTVRDFIAGKFEGAEQMVTARIALEDVQEKGFEQLVKHRDEHVKILATPKRELLASG
ncbi:hypothetical protein LTR85_001046 [Meristemomyces frigidus]|nr:hypothetical protein LTR85_001046 [Meristemomyces frigidus]